MAGSLGHFWFAALDIERRRGALNRRLRRLALRALDRAGRSVRLTIIATCVIPTGVRLIARAKSTASMRVLMRRFVAYFAVGAGTHALRWRPTVQLAAIHPGRLPLYHSYMTRSSPDSEDIETMKPRKNVKRLGVRAGLAALRSIERANAELLGMDEYSARVRRYVAAHDAPADDTVAFERLCLAIFAQGLSFDAVDKHREVLRSAFDGFDPAAVARITAQRAAALLQEPIIRNRSKIEGCVENARRWVALTDASGQYLARIAGIAADDHPAEGWPKLTAALQRDFARLGESTAGLTLKRWGFFTARCHPGSQRLLRRLGYVNDGRPQKVQEFVAALAQAGGKDPYAVEAALALFAAVGPCKADPSCAVCLLNEGCPSAAAPDAAVS